MSQDNRNRDDHLDMNEIHRFLRKNAGLEELPSHAEECDNCREIFFAEKEFFQQLQQETAVSPNHDLWSKIEMQHRFIQQERKNRLKTWSFVSVAASLLLVVGLQWNSLNSSQNIQNQIQASIFQSQQLEKRRAKLEGETQKNIQMTGYSSHLSINQELQKIDEALQLAYQQNKRQELILDLWNKRIEVLSRQEHSSDAAKNIETI